MHILPIHIEYMYVEYKVPLKLRGNGQFDEINLMRIQSKQAKNLNSFKDGIDSLPILNAKAYSSSVGIAYHSNILITITINNFIFKIESRCLSWFEHVMRIDSSRITRRLDTNGCQQTRQINDKLGRKNYRRRLPTVENVEMKAQ